VATVVEATVKPRGPYRLRLMRPSGRFATPLPDGGSAVSWQTPSGAVHIRATSERGLEQARFMLALDDDTSEFQRRFSRDCLLGPSVRALTGLRPLRLPSVAHAVLRALCGQLIESSRARAIERSILRRTGSGAPSAHDLAQFSPAQLCALGLSSQRAAALVRVCRGIDLEGLRVQPTRCAIARLGRERGLGPWSCGVIALEGLGRYEQPLVGDLGLVKLASSLWGRWIDPSETEDLLAPYGEWAGLASVVLLAGWKRGLVPGADADRARVVRARARRAA
jgi:3-methyladenine DNA glycosylase/8-oxoguanine DNA glycosylase